MFKLKTLWKHFNTYKLLLSRKTKNFISRSMLSLKFFFQNPMWNLRNKLLPEHRSMSSCVSKGTGNFEKQSISIAESIGQKNHSKVFKNKKSMWQLEKDIENCIKMRKPSIPLQLWYFIISKRSWMMIRTATLQCPCLMEWIISMQQNQPTFTTL